MATDRSLSEKFTVGVEEEYQLVDGDTGELRSHGEAVRKADRTGEVEGEVQKTMVEIGTPICCNADELTERLAERRFQAAAAAAAEDLEIVAAGTHPFSSWRDQVLSTEQRPRMLSKLFRQLLRQQSIWGLHVHVAIPEEIDRVVLMNTVRTFGPHLLALSCSSPFHLGVDTGFDSFRTVSWRGFPFIGVPPQFDSEQAYDEYVDLLLRAGRIPDPRTLYWSVRPSARYRTLELRMCDACPSMRDAIAIASFGRAIIVAASEGMLQPMGSSLRPSLQDEILRENEWLAARDGLGAQLVAPETPDGVVGVRDSIRSLLDAVEPVAARLGDLAAVERIAMILEEGNSSERMRKYLAGGGDIRSVVQWLTEETRAGTGIDRRSERRRNPDAKPISLTQP